MGDSVVRACILDLLRCAKNNSPQLRRRCNAQWYRELKSLSGEKLDKRLRYVSWWCPVRSIEKAYKRGTLSGQRAVVCVFNVLRSRGLDEAWSIQGLITEATGKQTF